MWGGSMTEATPAINGEAYFLSSVSGWSIGCGYELENQKQVDYLK
jgi:hypothetical protein